MVDRDDALVVSQEEIGEGIYRLIVETPLALEALPGQFLHVKVAEGFEPLLRRPISIADAERKTGRITLIYRVEGRGTALLARKQKGEKVDILGPLGQGFPTHLRRRGERALLVGGGIGVPPLYYLAKVLFSMGVEVVVLLGFAGKGQAIFIEEFGRLGEVKVSTDDGSLGEKGLVTRFLPEEDEKGWTALYSCGPTPMLKGIEERYRGKEREVYLSLEERMGCGIGACLACMIPPGEKGKKSYYKICRDGPVFRLGEVKLS
ncbi:MAG: dihydroorotate dehydrogenase electron transfer subunit [Thermicanus sp.]|nr:dihydroorotate dehydrogenase electron transfer subunit [Thermicanus sp.]